MNAVMPRPVAKFVAGLLGYFWLPCPECGRMFAGFEWNGSIPTDKPGIRQGICCGSEYEVWEAPAPSQTAGAVEPAHSNGTDAE